MFTSNPEIQIEVEVLARLLRELPIGNILTYQMGTDAIGRDVQFTARFSLIKACNIVEKEVGQRFSTVRKVGVKRLNSNEVVGIGLDARRRIGRVATRGSRRLTGLKYNSVSPEAQKQIDIERSVLGAVSSLTGQKAINAVTEKASSTGPLPAALVFEAMK